MGKVFRIENQISLECFYSFFEDYRDKNFRFDGEIHDFWECVYVTKGSLRVSGDERIYNLYEGDIVFHKPLELHKFAVTSEAGATILVFSFSMTGPLTDYFKDKVFSLSHTQKNIISEMREYINSKKQKTDGLLAFIYLYPSKVYSDYLQTLSLYVTRLFLSLADNGSETKSLITPEAMLYKKAMEHMELNVYENLTVSDIAKYCAISESGLKRIFSKYAGLSIHKCFLNMKIKKALTLLGEGKSVTETAEILNFASQSYFSVAFKRETGKLAKTINAKDAQNVDI